MYRYLLKELQERVRQAIALPVRIAVTDVFDGTLTQLLISAPIDSGAYRVQGIFNDYLVIILELQVLSPETCTQLLIFAPLTRVRSGFNNATHCLRSFSG